MPNLQDLLSRASAPLPLDRSLLRVDAETCDACRRGSGGLFPDAAHPEAALAGLLLKLGCWSESHSVAQDVESPEGSYWHAIVHRIEPDSSNAGYWFRRVGKHAIFTELFHRAQEILRAKGPRHWKLHTHWDPFLFIDWCDEARAQKGDAANAAMEIQETEWRLLFDYCVAPWPEKMA